MKPKISIVATSRNDNHGGDLLTRMQIFVDGVIEQSKRFNFSLELILVEWNPPTDKPRLAEALNWPDDISPCSVRIVEVPPEIHNRYECSQGLPLFQMIAKNVGIVRAKGDFVLSTNVDIIFSDKLMKFLCEQRLEKGKYYRADRHDVLNSMPLNSSFEEKREYCRNNTIRICHKEGITDCIKNETTLFFPLLPFVGKRLHLIPLWKQLIKLGKTRLFKFPFKLMGHYRLWLRLHTNACGDFTMMSKDDWYSIRGAPELEIFSLHIDSLVCYIAHYAGIKEEILEDPIYHVDHSGGWSPEVEEDRSLYDRMKKVNVPILSIKEMDDWISDLYHHRRPIVYNSENWGLADVELKETII